MSLKNNFAYHLSERKKLSGLVSPNNQAKQLQTHVE